MKIDVTTLDAKKAGQIDLDETIFGLEPRADILHRVVTWQLAKRRGGSHKAQERNEVNGTTKKMHRQKGTGGARHGDKKAPQFRGGGKAHGPRVRSHEFDLPKKVRRLGLRHALSAKAGAKELIVLDAATASEPKTKALAAQFGKLGLDNALIVDGAMVDDNFRLAARNLPNVDVLPLHGLNVYDILRRRQLVLTKSAVDGLMARFDENASQGAKA